MGKKDVLRLDNQLCFAVYAAAKEIVRLYRPLLDNLHITYTQYLILLVMWETNPVSFKELSEKLYLDSGTLSPVLKKMAEKGLLVRTRLTEDERQVILQLTAKGLTLKEEALAIPERMLCRLPLSFGAAAALRQELQCLLTKLPREE